MDKTTTLPPGLLFGVETPSNNPGAKSSEDAGHRRRRNVREKKYQ